MKQAINIKVRKNMNVTEVRVKNQNNFEWSMIWVCMCGGGDNDLCVSEYTEKQD